MINLLLSISLFYCLKRFDEVIIRSAATGRVGAPKLPGVASPSVHLDCAVQVLARIARSSSSTALSPVDLSNEKTTLLICQSPISYEPLEL